ncbi:MAG: phenylacetic acid degradation protein PaaD [Cyanobacteria bacterium PR.3.49]|nr:phenylacetic acid degradation protein PaaD [Cyanobacteria bacterium PR.3.49]
METAKTSADVARQVAEYMLRHDRASSHLGIAIESVDEGQAVLSMTVRNDMLNGLDILHGGVTFTLADSAFAFACNSRNRKTVALNCTVAFVAAARAGDVLTATAREVSLSGRTGIYDVSVKNQDGELVAEFRGTSYGTSSAVL